MKTVFLAAMASVAGLVSAARATDQVAIGPAPAWVKPAAAPTAKTDAGEAAVRLILFDDQAHFGSEGTSEYSERIAKVQTPQGLQAFSTLSLTWNPELGGITIHKVQILRDGQVIDVLAKQKFTVVRREANLENAVLDGVLTAIIQPEDLRVGDVIDLAYTETQSDPALAGHVQFEMEAPNTPIDELKLSAVGERVAVRWRASEGFDGLKPNVSAEGRTVAVQMKGMQPIIPPAGAPARFRHGRLIEITDFKSWAEVSAVMAPLFAKAAVLPADSPLQADVAKIKAASADPKVRAQAALTLVQDQVRYIALNLNDGGLVPADAQTTWTRRFGDCKGKTALLMALLKALGVEAQPVMVNAEGNGDGLDGRLPMVGAFDHVLVRAMIGGRAYWLDGTRQGDRSLDDIDTPDFVWGLPVQASGAVLVRLEQPPLDRPSVAVDLHIDASAGIDIPAPAHGETILHGDAAVSMNQSLANMTAVQKDAALRDYWAKLNQSVTVNAVSASFDPVKREARLQMDGLAKMEWREGTGTARFYEADHSVLGWNADFSRAPGPHADAPYIVDYPAYERATETIVLPYKGEGFIIEGPDVDQRLAGRAFRRKTRIDKGVFVMEAETRGLQPEFPASEAPAAQAALRDMSKDGVYVGTPAVYQMTKQELDQYEEKPLITAADLLARGDLLMQRGRLAKAKLDLERATTLDPKSIAAWGDLAEVHAAMGDFKGAHLALAKTVEIGPDEIVSLKAAIYVATNEAEYSRAVGYLDKLIAKEPTNALYREQRMWAYWNDGQPEKALDDVEVLLKASPTDQNARQAKLGMLLYTGKLEAALAEAETAIAAEPKAAWPRRRKAEVLDFGGHRLEAQAAYDEELVLNPTAGGHLARARVRAVADYKARLNDVAEAIKLQPDNLSALAETAVYEAWLGQVDKASKDIDALIEKHPKSALAHSTRAFIHMRAGHEDEAVADMDWVRSNISGGANDWNNLCYDQAKWGISLTKALADCDKAVSMAPHAAAYLDSRAFVLFRLGRTDEAIATYDAALKSNPWEWAALFGRGLARIRKGQIQEGKADLRAARALNPKIDAVFAEYGVVDPTAEKTEKATLADR